MKKPIGVSSLEEQISPETTVTILVEDLTRKSPKKIVLGKLLERLAAIGVQKRNIAIVIALGTHQPLSTSEFESAFGSKTVADYSFFNHDCRDDDLVPVGRLASGASVKINRIVFEADFRIGIGSIFPHPLNGFGGGGKILFPGVADIDSITEHHLKHSFRGNAFLGNLEDNAFYDEINAMAKAGRLDFIINSVLDHNDCLHDIVCGDPFQAHRAGAALCKTIISKSFAAKSDVTIISAFPYTEGPQIMKPLAPADMITKKGGTIILYADCKGALPETYFQACESFLDAHKGQLREKVLAHFADNRPITPDAPPELNMSMAQVMLALNDYKIVLVTKDILRNQVKRIGFSHAADLDEAVALCQQTKAKQTVNIVPSGGVILPVVSEP
jgi:nickel-dependent lactate racemase